MTHQEKTYKIVRFYRDDNKPSRTIKRGLTLTQAQAHCQDEKTHKVKPNGDVVWFDGYTEE